MTQEKTAWLWLHISKDSSTQTMHLPEFTRAKAEEYGKGLLNDWVRSVPRPRNTEPDDLQTQLKAAVHYRNQ